MGKCSGYHLVSKSQFCQKSGHSTFVLSTIVIQVLCICYSIINFVCGGLLPLAKLFHLKPL